MASSVSDAAPESTQHPGTDPLRPSWSEMSALPCNGSASNDSLESKLQRQQSQNPPHVRPPVIERCFENPASLKLEGRSSTNGWLCLKYDPNKRVLRIEESGKQTKVCGKVEMKEWEVLRQCETLGEWHGKVHGLFQKAKAERRIWNCEPKSSSVQPSAHVKADAIQSTAE